MEKDTILADKTVAEKELGVKMREAIQCDHDTMLSFPMLVIHVILKFQA